MAISNEQWKQIIEESKNLKTLNTSFAGTDISARLVNNEGKTKEVPELQCISVETKKNFFGTQKIKGKMTFVLLSDDPTVELDKYKFFFFLYLKATNI